jgi:hypothetical protein
MNQLVALFALVAVASTATTELTFEMDEHSTQCFYEDIGPDRPAVVFEHEVPFPPDNLI